MEVDKIVRECEHWATRAEKVKAKRAQEIQKLQSLEAENVFLKAENKALIWVFNIWTSITSIAVQSYVKAAGDLINDPESEEPNDPGPEQPCSSNSVYSTNTLAVKGGYQPISPKVEFEWCTHL